MQDKDAALVSKLETFHRIGPIDSSLTDFTLFAHECGRLLQDKEVLTQRVQELLIANNNLVERERIMARKYKEASALHAEILAADNDFVPETFPEKGSPDDAPGKVFVNITVKWELFKKLVRLVV